LNGLRAARAYAASDPAAVVLLVAVELCTLHLQYGWDAGQSVANALFADGAAAVVVGAGDGPELAAHGSCLFADSRDAMTWTIGDHGFAMTLSAKVPDLIAAELQPWLSGWLAQHGLTVAEVGGWAVHPGGPRILDSVQRALGLPDGATAISRQVLAACGNMSSPTVVFILERMWRAAVPRPWVALGFGPGLTAEAALLR
jgi:prepilin-type processing-associated H-X9-DG protein